MSQGTQDFLGSAVAFGLVVLVVMAIVAVPLWGLPKFGVYRADLAGQAELSQASHNRQIAIAEAEAELASADLKAQADVIRAAGIAEANEIIGKSITMEYIQWRWVEGLHNGETEVIYVPTEANLPILEATRSQSFSVIIED